MDVNTPASPTTADQCAPLEEPIEEPLSEDQQELSRIMGKVSETLDLMGIFHLGSDGVLRSLTADRDVVDAVALRPRLIKAMLDRYPEPIDAPRSGSSTLFF